MLNRIAHLTRTMPYYAVRRGRRPGIYPTWAACEAQVKGFSGAQYRKFKSQVEADAWMDADADFAPSGPPGRAAHGSGGYSSAPHKRPLPEDEDTYPYYSSDRDQSPYDDWEPHIDYASLSPPSKRFHAEIPSVYVDLPQRASDSDVRALQRHGEHAVVYCDGSALGNGRTSARAGYGVFWAHDHPWNVGEPLEGPVQTNQRAELQAALTVVRQSETLWPGPLEICTDSHYTIKAMTQWVPAWERRAAERGDGVWRTTSGGPPDNEDLMREIVECLKYRARPVKWTYVPGHSGVPGNEAADKLAKMGARAHRY